MLRRRRPPVERVDPDAFVVRLEDTEREVLASLLDDLDRLLDEAGDPEREVTPVVTRLFPPAFTDHEGRDSARSHLNRRATNRLHHAGRQGLSL